MLSWRAPANTHRGALKQAAEDEHRETMCGATPCTLHPEWKSYFSLFLSESAADGILNVCECGWSEQWEALGGREVGEGCI